MGTLADMFRAAGIWMYLILTINLVVYPLLVLATLFFGWTFRKATSGRRSKRITIGVIMLVSALILALAGILGWQLSLIDMEQALIQTAPEHVDMMRHYGESGARGSLLFGLGSAALPGLGGIVFLLTGLFTQSTKP